MTDIYWVLQNTPIWATALVLWFSTDGMIHLMRDRFEGLGYQVSYAAKFGDAGLVAAVLIAATLLQRDGVQVPDVLNGGFAQLFVALACILLGAVVSIKTIGHRSGHLADIYHDVVIGPAILFFTITLLPVYWLNARWWEWMVLAVAVVVWALLVWFDIKTNRMNQREWLRRHGFPM